MSILFETPESTNKWQLLQSNKKQLLADLAILFKQVKAKRIELDNVKADILELRNSDDRKIVYITPLWYDFDKFTEYMLDKYNNGQKLPVNVINGILLNKHIGRKRVKQAMLEAGFIISDGLYKH